MELFTKLSVTPYVLIPNPFAHSNTDPVPEPPHSLVHTDVQWNRPVFKAPPLKVKPPVYKNIQSFLDEINRVNRTPEKR